MNDLEINRKLALAIGWREDQINVDAGGTYIQVPYLKFNWVKRYFDHADWQVAGPIAQKFDCFPFLWTVNRGKPCWATSEGPTADTPQRAIAMAVIGAGK